MTDPSCLQASRPLVTTVVRLRPLDQCAPEPRGDVAKRATSAADAPGLIRRYFLGDAQAPGGLYLWTDRSAAERFHTHEWRRRLAEQFGVRAEVLFIERAVEA
jgi:hypothetical protein